MDLCFIDTDVLIDHLRKKRNALDFLSKEIEEGSLLFVSVISRVEIFAGMRRGEEDAVICLFDLITPIEVDMTIADKAGDYMRKFSKSHALNIGDAIIAATTREMTLKLITKNVKHYPMKDIEVSRPY
ncbi:MAG TPA: type II toxin-antitoxin system VapC family toxin [Nitrospirae bacterium]|nr:type II toxin-antitoxin system VapC family toxin [Nitrospirota bacterium]HDZ00118.1 type II toxin-antitoxin system VapC family toxin [Nitrospirota bacterium]